MPGNLRFHLDESVTRKVADGLRRRDIDCTSTPEQGMIGRSDEDQLAFAKSDGRVLITADVDFLAISAVNSDHAGIIFWLQDRHFGQLIRELHEMSFAKQPNDLAGRVMFIA